MKSNQMTQLILSVKLISFHKISRLDILQQRYSCQIILWSSCAMMQTIVEHYVLVLKLLPEWAANSGIPRLVLQILISQGIVGSTQNLFNQPNPPRPSNLGSYWCNWSNCLAEKEKQFNPTTSARRELSVNFFVEWKSRRSLQLAR